MLASLPAIEVIDRQVQEALAEDVGQGDHHKLHGRGLPVCQSGFLLIPHFLHSLRYCSR